MAKKDDEKSVKKTTSSSKGSKNADAKKPANTRKKVEDKIVVEEPTIEPMPEPTMEENITEPTVYDSTVTENSNLKNEFDKVNKDTNKLLWIAITILGGVLTIILIFATVKLFANSISYMKYSSFGQEQIVVDSYNQGYKEGLRYGGVQGYDEGYLEGYEQGYYEGMYSMNGGNYMNEPNCDYNYMLEYGYQDGCVYIPENETIVPDNGIMPKNNQYNSMPMP